MSYAQIEDVEHYLNVVFTPAGRTIVQGYLDAASAKIDSFCQRDFLLHTDAAIKCDGNDLDTLLIRETPIISIASLKIDNDVISSDKFVSYDWGKIRLKNGLTFTEDIQNIEIVLTHGYLEVPGMIKHICVLLVKDLIHGTLKFEETEGANEIKMGDIEVRYEDADKTILLTDKMKEDLLPFVKKFVEVV